MDHVLGIDWLVKLPGECELAVKGGALGLQKGAGLEGEEISPRRLTEGSGAD
jgi:hypothetical protein